MPLFGHKDNTYPATTTTGAGTGPLHRNEPVIGTHDPYTAPTTGTTHTGTGLFHRNQNTTALPAQGGYADPAYGSSATGVTTGSGLGHNNTLGQNTHANTNTLGTSGATTTTAAHPSTGGAAMKTVIGKVEHAAGTVLCSQNLKQKGLMKEQEAAALKQQNVHLNRAEAIEQQAARERDLAVTAGAHQDHAQLGGPGGAGGRTGVY